MEVNKALVNKILENKEKEKLLYELKCFEIFDNSNFEEKIGKEIVAFANRLGGMILFGVEDNGKPQRTLSHEKIESYKQQIENLIKYKISPQIDYKTDVQPYNGNDIFILEIKKKSLMPYAYVERGGHEIKNRKFYVRTEVGTKLVDDTTLYWLFSHEGENKISLDFVHILNIDWKEKRLLNESVPRCINKYDYFFLKPYRDAGKPFRNQHEFFTQLTPYVFLLDLAKVFSKSWYVDYSFDEMIFGLSDRKSKRTIEVIFVKSNELCHSIDGTVLNYLNVDFKNILEKPSLFQIGLPLQTKIEIVHSHNGSLSSIFFKNLNFLIEIKFNCISSGCQGIYPKHYLSKQDDVTIASKYEYIVYKCSYKANFTFPDYENELFEEHFHFANTIKNFITCEWDARRYCSEEMPNEILKKIYKNLNQ